MLSHAVTLFAFLRVLRGPWQRQCPRARACAAGGRVLPALACLVFAVSEMFEGPPFCKYAVLLIFRTFLNLKLSAFSL